MELPLALTIGLLFAGAMYSILRPNLVRMVIGFGLLSNAVNLVMIACGGYQLGADAPFVRDPANVAGLMDPLPPDIVLTAIVISFAVGALFLTICYVVYRDYGTDNPEELPHPLLDDESYRPQPSRRLRYEE
ncbi:MAG TPA: sodium:proton antiporter [Candidatus Limnocylindria bacterium]|nr:sodium:proton antiporter [Candidatus Limnocylindria bacterium]